MVITIEENNVAIFLSVIKSGRPYEFLKLLTFYTYIQFLKIKFDWATDTNSILRLLQCLHSALVSVPTLLIKKLIISVKYQLNCL